MPTWRMESEWEHNLHNDISNCAFTFLKQLREMVKTGGEAGLYANASDYVCDLIRRDVEKREKTEALRVLVQEAEQSGFVTMTPEEL